MLAFDGTELPETMTSRLSHAPSAGVTLFRYRNVADPAQVRRLTDAIQACSPDGLPFLVATDQEGGQLLGLGASSTPFAGNMALGAAGDPHLAQRVGRAIGLELRAAGVNVNYAPVADLATNPANPSLGVRSFGDDPSAGGELVASFVRGLGQAGVAATLKHFPGKGDAGVDTHHELATVSRSAEEFNAVELAPFRSGIAAGASLVMAGHVAAPALSGDESQPATLARPVLHDLLRDGLGFEGVAISDAFDMDALARGPARAIDAIAGLRAGLDLILLGGNSDLGLFDDMLTAAARHGLFDADAMARSLARVSGLRRWLGDGIQPGLDVVGCADHQALARELAERSVTLVRDRDGLLPLRLAAEDRVLVVMPRPTDLTPADTSAAVRPALADAIRRRHGAVEELVVSHGPGGDEISGAVARARDMALLVIGSVSAALEPSQASLVRALLETGVPAVTVALRTPWDLPVYPSASTHICTYSILEPSLEALSAALFGELAFAGRLPVALNGARVWA